MAKSSANDKARSFHTERSSVLRRQACSFGNLVQIAMFEKKREPPLYHFKSFPGHDPWESTTYQVRMKCNSDKTSSAPPAQHRSLGSAG
ncbi:unnamed protein product [Ixodes pacificus]